MDILYIKPDATVVTLIPASQHPLLNVFNSCWTSKWPGTSPNHV
jgi:hypothetical protein